MNRERTIIILDAVIRFLEDNPVKDYTVFYDGTECDGYCLQDDARALLEAVEEGEEY